MSCLTEKTVKGIFFMCLLLHLIFQSSAVTVCKALHTLHNTAEALHDPLHSVHKYAKTEKISVHPTDRKKIRLLFIP